MTRRTDRQGEVLIWCRKCSGHVRQRMGLELMNCCKPEQVGTTEYGKMLKRIQVLEDGRIPAKEVRNWKIEGQKRRITWKEYRILSNDFEMGGSISQKSLWNVAREKMLQDRGALPKEEGDIVRECKAMHGDNFLSSWLREDVEGTEERRKKMDKEAREEESRSGKREGEKGEEEAVGVKRRCVNPFSSDVFEEFTPVEDSDSCGDSVCA